MPNLEFQIYQILFVHTPNVVRVGPASIYTGDIRCSIIINWVVMMAITKVGGNTKRVDTFSGFAV